jgi:hypothetical protein
LNTYIFYGVIIKVKLHLGSENTYICKEGTDMVLVELNDGKAVSTESFNFEDLYNIIEILLLNLCLKGR